MGTNFKEGQKPQNNITVSKSGETSKINPDSGKVDRSFAQPNPAIPHPVVEPKAHASVKEEAEALTKNSTQGRSYEKDEDGDKSDEK